MNYGRFFTLDVNASQLVRGLTVFNYRGIKNKQVSTDNSRDKYPIYVNISKDLISFSVHYIKEGQDSAEHSNSLIFSLPIASNLNIKYNITSNIINIFSNQFPYNNEGNIIYDIAANSIQNTEECNKGISYSSLEVFGINLKKPETEDRPPIIGLLRKLFLDFIYDLEHTGVFKNAPGYDEIYASLNDNFLFRSIRNKAEYYYQRKSASPYNDKDERGYFTHSDRDIFMADYLVEAERRWVETIADPRSDATFHAAKGWLRSTEEEMHAVYHSGHLSYPNSDIKSKYSTDRCADFLSKIKFPKSDDRTKVEYNKRCTKEYDTQVVETARKATQWYLHKYCFAGILNIWHGRQNGAWKWMYAILSIFLLLTIVYPAFNQTVSDDYLHSIMIAGGLLVFVRLIRYLRDRKRLGRVGRVNIFMPRLLASVVTAWFTLAIGEDIFRGFFDTEHQLWISAVLVIITFVFVSFEIGRLNPYLDRSKTIGRSITLLVMAFTYSLLSGILIISFFGDKYLNRGDYVADFYADKVFTENRDYKMDSLKQMDYLSSQFYEVISRHDTEIMNRIGGLKPNIDSSLPDSIRKYLCTPCCVKTDSIKYGITIGLLSIFSSNDTDNEQRMLKEVHANMTEGALVRQKTRFLKDAIEKMKDSLITIDATMLRHMHIIYNEDGAVVKDNSWIIFLKSINDNQLYKETLEYLRNDEGESALVLESKRKIQVYKNMLLQFAFIAMFIGVFLQLIFEDKPVTEPI